MNHKLKYPTLYQTQIATMDQIKYWYVELPSPTAKNKIDMRAEQKVMELIKHRYETED
jgi:hypothetical protein